MYDNRWSRARNETPPLRTSAKSPTTPILLPVLKSAVLELRATMERLKRELYEEPPEIVIKTVLRWLMTDPEYKRRFILYLSRVIPPDTWLSSSFVRGALVRGALRDVRRLLRLDAS